MKNLIVVGAGKGIGLRVCQLLAPENSLFTISRTGSAELNLLHTNYHQLDVTKQSAATIEDLPDVIHGLVYCPGSINLKPFHRFSQEDFFNELQQNFLAAVDIIQNCLPALRRANGASIVLFSSVAAKVGMPFHTAISAAKGAVEGFGKSLAAELASAQIRVNVIAPSLTDTSLASPLLNTIEKRESAAKRHPLQRIGTADDIAKMVVFLLSNESSWITGQVLAVDGGLSSLKV